MWTTIDAAGVLHPYCAAALVLQCYQGVPVLNCELALKFSQRFIGMESRKGEYEKKTNG